MPGGPSPVQVWPHDQPGRGMDASDTTPHWAYQHAVQYWVTQVGKRCACCPSCFRRCIAQLPVRSCCCATATGAPIVTLEQLLAAVHDATPRGPSCRRCGTAAWCG